MIKSIQHILFVCAVILLTACNTSVLTDSLPVVTTFAASNVTQTSATSGGKVLLNTGQQILACGICYSANSVPTPKDNITTDNVGTGEFSSFLTNLSAGTTYYVRAYATNANGTVYGRVLHITTAPDNTVPNPILNTALTYGSTTDIDGNVYQTISIGSQTWMAQNLQVTKFRNGDIIPTATDNFAWNTLTTPAQCTYNNDVISYSTAKFGRMYNYYCVADARNIAPIGWHIASDTEWKTLEDYVATNLGTSTSVAQALATQTDWAESTLTDVVGNLFTNNSSGFCALPAGLRGDYGDFNYMANYSGWWTSTSKDAYSAWFRSMNFYGKTVGRNVYGKYYGLSVRCVKD